MASLNRIADVSLKGTLGAAQSENAYLKERYADALERERVLLERLAALEAENSRLRAPLSDAEWRANSIQCEAEHIGGFMMDRVDFDDVIAARAQQPSPAQDKEQP